MGRPRLLLVLLVLAALTLTALDARQEQGSPFDVLRRGADTVAGPLLRASGAAVQAARSGADAVLPDGTGQRERRLERENAALRGQLEQAQALQAGAEALRAVLALRALDEAEVVPARVLGIGRDLGFAWTATLDAGSRDGLRVGQTVVAGGGLVGRTKRVGPFTSTVVLLVDPGATVGGRLQRRGGVGLVRGDGDAPLRYELLDAADPVRPGDVVTTVESDIYLPDVPIGTITRLLPGRSALTRVAEIAPFVDVAALDLVGVVVGGARSGARTPVAR